MIADTENSTESGLPYGRYQIRKRIARGGMGEVFLADQMGPTGMAIRPVALKRMLPRMARKPHAAQMFLEEMATAAQLNHPNIATTYDFGEVNGTYFMAMEYLEGLSLHQILSVLGAIPVPHAVDIAQKVLQALNHAHQRKTPAGQPAPVVHRDVSPHNIMVSTSGDVKLLDFGIARAETEALGGRLEGKIAYAAPEQLRGDNVDRRSDLWAVGILLYESLCGVRPYEFNEAHLMEEAARQGVYTPVGTLRPEAIPLEEIIARSLKYEPNERWTDAESTMNALNACAKQFRPVTSSEMASLIHSAGGPAKSVLGVEQITSFGGTTVGDSSNRTETIPLVEKPMAGPSTAAPSNSSALSPAVKKPFVNFTLAAILIIISGLAALLIHRQQVEQTPSITSIPLPQDSVPPKPAPIAKPKPSVTVQPASKPPVRAKVSAQPKTEAAPQKPQRTKTLASPVKRRPNKPKFKPAKKPVRAPPPARPQAQTKPEAVRPAVAKSPGRLSISSTPWAQIQINNESLGETPKLNIQLPAGKHRLVLTPADGTPGARKVMTIEIKPKQHLRIIANFNTNTFRTLGN